MLLNFSGIADSPIQTLIRRPQRELDVRSAKQKLSISDSEQVYRQSTDLAIQSNP